MVVRQQVVGIPRSDHWNAELVQQTEKGGVLPGQADARAGVAHRALRRGQPFDDLATDRLQAGGLELQRVFRRIVAPQGRRIDLRRPAHDQRNVGAPPGPCATVLARCKGASR